MHYYLDKFNQTGVFKCFKQGMQNSVAIEDCREGSLPNNQPLLLITVSVIIPRPLFWKGIRCCARLACLEVIDVPLWLMQLDEMGCDIHYQRLNNVFRHKGVPMICPSTASQQGAKTLCIHTTWMWDAVNRGLQPQPWSYNIIRQWGFSASTMTPQHHTGSAIPLFPWNSPPSAHAMVWYGIRVHRYAHLQHLKVLKHFAYIQYGCGMQSMGVWSLNHDTAISYRLGHTPFPLKTLPTCTCNGTA
jgi:hypothetical protein